MLPLSPIIFHTTDSMLDRPSCVTVAGNNKKERREKKRGARDEKKEHISMIETTLRFEISSTCFTRPRVRSIEKSYRLTGSALIQMEEEGKSVFIVNEIDLFDWSFSLHLQNGPKSLLITWRIETIIGRVFFIPSISIRIHYLRRGIKCQTSVILSGRCRDNLFVAEFRDDNRY